MHDLLEHMYGSRNASSLRRSLHFYLTRRVLRKAARVIAVSQFTKNEIEKLLAIPDDRIEVVYNAIDERFLHGHATEADRELIAQRYLVNYPFILYAGAIRPHKNVVRIIEAFSALKSELQKEQQYPGSEAHHHRRRSFEPSAAATHRGAQRRAERRAFSGIRAHRSAAHFL